jgi:nucleoside-diphosphate-sugar epimerase
MAYHRTHGVDTKIVRIFNCFGPGLAPGDGRVVSNFLAQAMAGEPLTVYGTGEQTRSFCYVADEVRGILALLASDWVGPMNIGNPEEHTIVELAKLVLEITGSKSELRFVDLPVDDPTRRCPDISQARDVLGWSPQVPLRTGVELTYEWYRCAADA